VQRDENFVATTSGAPVSKPAFRMAKSNANWNPAFQRKFKT
jgi:hypothetical protein